MLTWGTSVMSILALVLITLPASAQQKGAAPPITCDTSKDSCAGTLSSLFAISHGYTPAETTTTVLYRVTINDPSNTTGPQPGSWSPGTHWGDGTNGFFYQAVVNGDTANPKIFVPFNGVGIGSDGQPALPPFSFIVKVDVTQTAPSVTISACASNFAGQVNAPACTKSFWVDTYSSLPMPEVGAAPVGITESTFSWSACNDPNCFTSNNGVYPLVMTLNIDSTITGNNLDWVLNHLVFFDKNGDAYTNDLYDPNGLTNGMLTREEAAYQITTNTGTTYFTKYGEVSGDTTKIPTPTANQKLLFFYTKKVAGSFDIYTGVIHDRPNNCTGFIEPSSTTNKACAQASAPPPLLLTESVSTVNGKPTVSGSKSADAGTQELRTVKFQVTPPANSSCTKALNPLAVQVTGKTPAYSMPNYVIGQSTDWTRKTNFPNGLYYVLPSGFGICDTTNKAPFCQQSGSPTAPFTAYVPHYLDSNSMGGPLNGGSTTASIVNSFRLADEYALPNLDGSKPNALVWFDNCGYGHEYIETYQSSPRKPLPKPPDNGKTYQYTIKNSLGRSLVFGKECCASWYQENQISESTVLLEPPVELDNGFGMVVPFNTKPKLGL